MCCGKNQAPALHRRLATPRLLPHRARVPALLQAIVIFAIGLALGTIAAMWFCHQRRQLDSAKSEAANAAALAVAEQQSARIPELETQLAAYQNERHENSARIAELETRIEEERKAGAEKLALLEDARGKLADAFNALSADALRKNNQSFLELAKETLEKFQEGARGDLEKRQQAIHEIVQPVRESLEKVDVKINEMEKARSGAYEGLTAQVRALIETQNMLRSETGNLAKALRSPIVRGRWGEVQLRRVVEMAEMIDHCDFSEQQSVLAAEGNAQRPDLVVRLPAGKTIVIDAKAPVAAYLDACEACEDGAKIECLARHARHVRDHIEALSRKAYWEQFEPAPEFVVLFLPGEMFFSAALERDPRLIEFGAEKRVILATPTTLIALLKAIFYGWRQQRLAENAQEISALGRDLYKRLSDMGEHLANTGRGLTKCVENYNKAVGSLETRVLVTARKFKDLHAAPPDVEIAELTQLDHIARQIQAPEFLGVLAERDALDSLANASE